MSNQKTDFNGKGVLYNGQIVSRQYYDAGHQSPAKSGNGQPSARYTANGRITGFNPVAARGQNSYGDSRQFQRNEPRDYYYDNDRDHDGRRNHHFNLADVFNPLSRFNRPHVEVFVGGRPGYYAGGYYGGQSYGYGGQSYFRQHNLEFNGGRGERDDKRDYEEAVRNDPRGPLVEKMHKYALEFRDSRDRTDHLFGAACNDALAITDPQRFNEVAEHLQWVRTKGKTGGVLGIGSRMDPEYVSAAYNHANARLKEDNATEVRRAEAVDPKKNVDKDGKPVPEVTVNATLDEQKALLKSTNVFDKEKNDEVTVKAVTDYLAAKGVPEDKIKHIREDLQKDGKDITGIGLSSSDSAKLILALNNNFKGDKLTDEQRDEITKVVTEIADNYKAGKSTDGISPADIALARQVSEKAGAVVK